MLRTASALKRIGVRWAPQNARQRKAESGNNHRLFLSGYCAVSCHLNKDGHNFPEVPHFHHRWRPPIFSRRIFLQIHIRTRLEGWSATAVVHDDWMADCGTGVTSPKRTAYIPGLRFLSVPTENPLCILSPQYGKIDSLRITRSDFL